MKAVDRRVEVFLDEEHALSRIGTMRVVSGSGRERVIFTYDADWVSNPGSFAIDQGLPVTPGDHLPAKGAEMFPVLGDSAPDSWGRSLMKRRERRQAEREGRPVRTLFETDFLMGVSDLTRIGALRLRWGGTDDFQAPMRSGVPGLIALEALLDATRRIETGEESDEDIELLFAPGASLGGARPKCSLHDVNGNLSIAKFPKPDDEYSKERWEAITAELARRAGIGMARTSMEIVRGKPVMLSQRYDRRIAPDGRQIRIPYMSAMTMTQNRDGEPGSYLEILDSIVENGSNPAHDRHELFRRILFTILVTNTDDHMRNHGFLRDGGAGWRLCPAFDINPNPDVGATRILTTRIDYDEATCSIDLALSVADEFGLSQKDAKAIAGEVARASSGWAEVARGYQAPEREITRMRSAFEHEDFRKSLGF